MKFTRCFGQWVGPCGLTFATLGKAFAFAYDQKAQVRQGA